MPRCVPYRGGFALTAGPLTDTDRAAIDRFEQFLRDAYDKDHNDMTQPDQTAPKPVEVDLAEAGVDGWVYVLQQAAAKKAELEEVIRTARGHIETALGDNVDGTIGGRPVVRWSHTAPPRQFNKKAFGKDHPDLLKQYTVFGTPGRRFEVLDVEDGQP